MALKAAHVSDVPNLHQVPENSTIPLCSSRLFKGVNDDGDDEVKFGYNLPKFMVIGHRGSGMNILQSCDPRMKSIQENSILSFNAASKFPIDFIEFDVQVTKDDCPVIFHDNFILTEDEGAIVERRVTELTLAEFICYGPQKEPGNVRKNLLRKTKDGRIFEWRVQNDDPLCTLQEAFVKVERSIGFNIELKFDDHMVYTEEELTHVLQAIMKVVNAYANDRPIIFSSFQPDAAQLIRNLQNTYPVFFLTNGGSEIYMDTRRNSLEEAIRVCLTGSLQGIVSEVRAIIRNPGAVTRIKESKLCLITYGQLNNVPEVARMQHLVGVEGVIVDFVKEITEAISDYIKPAKDYDEDSLFVEEAEKQETTMPRFTQHELSLLLLKISPELIKS
ncbi:glycerophosphodiester phosphodiesterase GDPD1, chloroplastic isoform X1 [Quercus suber]|uniref:glycerophosphodiester phosphodiesterase n=1 Tax=Quercus suber TaxID=58331 RepID=A0AAW0JNF1_QUESU|nr:glycerophosphodiester phosphodiesterase GDPD1, chloroplastic-like [Quercus suber]POE73507.1 glycerophosphodiester phosphodiesterase gdpd1, chloroplastic [Quercus suber]